MTGVEHEIVDLMRAMEAELQRLALWERHPPPPAALQSEQPFCFDTLTFTQWLQWVFIPRVRSVVATGQALPTASDIYPLAEHVFEHSDHDAAALLRMIARFDSLICSGRAH